MDPGTGYGALTLYQKDGKALRSTVKRHSSYVSPSSVYRKIWSESDT